MTSMECSECKAPVGERCRKGFGPGQFRGGVFMHPSRISAWIPPTADQLAERAAMIKAKNAAKYAKQKEETKKKKEEKRLKQQQERAQWEALAPHREAQRLAAIKEYEQEARRRRIKADHDRQLDTWDQEDPIGKKRQRLVRWLMRRKVPLDKARLIAWKKYR